MIILMCFIFSLSCCPLKALKANLAPASEDSAEKTMGTNQEDMVYGNYSEEDKDAARGVFDKYDLDGGGAVQTCPPNPSHFAHFILIVVLID